MWEIPAAIGGVQALGGIIGLLGSHKPHNYEPNEALIKAHQRAEQMANTGYSASEIADYMGRLTNLNAQKYSLATSRGGGLNQWINAGINYGNVNGLNSFAAANSQKKQANQRYADSFAQQFQNIDNMNTNLGWQNYNREQQAFGGALQAGINNVALGGMMGSGNRPEVTPATTQGEDSGVGIRYGGLGQPYDVGMRFNLGFKPRKY